jgi:hypothetical protein
MPFLATLRVYHILPFPFVKVREMGTLWEDTVQCYEMMAEAASVGSSELKGSDHRPEERQAT